MQPAAVNLDTGEGLDEDTWALIQELRDANDDLRGKNAALAGSVSFLQKQQMQAG